MSRDRSRDRRVVNCDVFLVGCGAVGSVFAALLIQKGLKVAIFEQRGEGLDWIRIQGDRQLSFKKGEDYLHFADLESAAAKGIKLSRNGMMLVATKISSFPQVIEYVTQFVQDQPIFLPQNGLFPELTFADLLDEGGAHQYKRNLVGGVLMGRSFPTRDDRGPIWNYSFMSLTIGTWERQGKRPGIIERTGDFLSNMGFVIQMLPEKEYREARLEKVFHNLVNSVTAVFDLDKVKLVLDDGPIQRIVESKQDECLNLAKQNGLHLDRFGDLKAKARNIFQTLVADHPTTMYQDFHRALDLKCSLETEIDHLDGAVVEMGRHVGYDLLTNSFFHQYVREFMNRFNRALQSDPEQAVEKARNLLKNNRVALSNSEKPDRIFCELTAALEKVFDN